MVESDLQRDKASIPFGFTYQERLPRRHAVWTMPTWSATNKSPPSLITWAVCLIWRINTELEGSSPASSALKRSLPLQGERHTHTGRHQLSAPSRLMCLKEIIGVFFVWVIVATLSLLIAVFKQNLTLCHIYFLYCILVKKATLTAGCIQFFISELSWIRC